ncbi:hypothetical protein Q7P37_003230 [Cladosporium fusiforme]
MSSMNDKNSDYGAPAQGSDNDARAFDPNPTIAAFAPASSGEPNNNNRSRASVLIHQKSPLLLATPPQVTRALAYSHSFILPLNHFVGLLSWTTGDPWESFLLVASFWFVVLYGETVLRYAGPIVLVALLTFGMYTRRYSPLSSTILTGEKKKKTNAHKRGSSDEVKQRKSLDEILDTLQTFTARCNILLDPLLRLTDFLSTQTTATAATTRPALTTLFIRILLCSPLWLLLTLTPFRILTTQRIVLAWGTFVLSWHSRPARVSRTILWRSRAVRTLTTLITGLDFPQSPSGLPATTDTTNPITPSANNPTTATSSPGTNTSTPPPEPNAFPLPETEAATTRWRWVAGRTWRVEGASTDSEKSAKRVGGGGGGDESGWTYYDNKWQDGRKTDGWGRYTRRRKWVRDAELVDVSADEGKLERAATESIPSPRKQKGWFGGGGGGGGGGTRRRTMSSKSVNERTDAVSASGFSGTSDRSRDGAEEDVHTPVNFQRQWEREIGEGLAEGLG